MADDELRAAMVPLLEKAEKEGLWLYQREKGHYWAPAQLRDMQNCGYHLYPVEVWELRSPWLEVRNCLSSVREKIQLLEIVLSEVAKSSGLPPSRIF